MDFLLEVQVLNPLTTGRPTRDITIINGMDFRNPDKKLKEKNLNNSNKS